MLHAQPPRTYVVVDLNVNPFLGICIEPKFRRDWDTRVKRSQVPCPVQLEPHASQQAI